MTVAVGYGACSRNGTERRTRQITAGKYVRSNRGRLFAGVKSQVDQVRRKSLGRQVIPSSGSQLFGVVSKSSKWRLLPQHLEKPRNRRVWALKLFRRTNIENGAHSKRDAMWAWLRSLSRSSAAFAHFPKKNKKIVSIDLFLGLFDRQEIDRRFEVHRQFHVAMPGRPAS